MIIGIWMYKRAQRSSIDHQPSYECTKLSRRQDINFEHAERVGTNGSIPDAVNPEFWELVSDASP